MKIENKTKEECLAHLKKLNKAMIQFIDNPDTCYWLGQEYSEWYKYYVEHYCSTV